jgi:hypothetical protein
MSDEQQVEYWAGWVGVGPNGVPVLSGSALPFPTVSRDIMGRQIADENAAAERATATIQDAADNRALAARLAGGFDETVSEYLQRKNRETGGTRTDEQVIEAERRKGLEPRPEVLSQREQTERQLQVSRVSHSRPGRAGRIHRIVHPGDELERTRARTFGAWADFGRTGR